MKICVLGDFSGNPEEGMRNISAYLVKDLSARHEVIKLNIKALFSIDFWNTVRRQKPHVVHYVTGPGLGSFLILRILKFFWSDTKTVMSALHPDNLELFSFVIRVVKPDIMLVQSKKSESFFNNLGVKTQFIPNAVDTKKFSPAKPEQKTTIRNMWGIPKENFVILHVGHIIKARNLEVLIELKKIPGIQVIIIASNFFQHDQKISDLLLEAGCKIIRGYIPNIEDAYKLADCYIFPVSIDESILTPLSVMEAMACNLPVITTKFEGLLELFPEGKGLFYIDDDDKYYRLVENIITKKNCTYTRDMVLPYTWKKISETIEKIYFDLVDEK